MDPRVLSRVGTAGALCLAAVLAGCVAAPVGALLQVMPGTDKAMAMFQDDQTVCKQSAQQAVAGPTDNASLGALSTVALTTVLGSGLGGAIAGAQGAGAATSPHDQGQVQQQYDKAYAQCMSNKGKPVPAASPTASR